MSPQLNPKLEQISDQPVTITNGFLIILFEETVKNFFFFFFWGGIYYKELLKLDILYGSSMADVGQFCVETSVGDLF